MIIEIVVYNIDSAIKAAEGGANRIELCDNPGDGGTTPSIGIIEIIKEKLDIDVFVMIRPRGGDFLYSDDEFEAMKKDIIQAKKAGADGVVLGILTADGHIDKLRCKELIQLAYPLPVTCHRAFDMTSNPDQALEDCIECGFTRILTSGGKPKAIDGLNLISRLMSRSEGKIKIMPGSGISVDNVQQIISQTRATEIHFSAATLVESNMRFRNSYISGMGSEKGSEFKLRTVNPQLIKDIRKRAEDAEARS